MEYLVAIVLLGTFAVMLWSKNGKNNHHSLTQDDRSIERIETLLQEIQSNYQSGQNQSLDKAQLARIEQKIDRILEEFEIKDSRKNFGYQINLQTEFDVILEKFPVTHKISIIKAVRIITGLGLKETKDLVESPLPVVVKHRLSERDAEKAQTILQEAGAQVSLR